MKVSIIYAQDITGAIGLAGPEPLQWHHKEDLERFKRLTQGKSIIMGTNTFDSLPKQLPNRFHYIVTRSKGLPRLGRLDDVQFVNSVEQAIERAASHGEEEVFIIGGAAIINNNINIADTIYRTTVLDHLVEPSDKAVRVTPFEVRPEKWTHLTVREVSSTDNLVFETFRRDGGNL